MKTNFFNRSIAHSLTLSILLAFLLCASAHAADNFLWSDAFQLGANNGSKNVILRGHDNGNGSWTLAVANPDGTNIGSSGGGTTAGAANVATSQVTASTTAGTLVIARATRRSCLIRNLDASINIYIGPATVTTATGMLLKPGESIPITAVTLWQVIAASGTPNVAILDEYD